MSFVCTVQSSTLRFPNREPTSFATQMASHTRHRLLGQSRSFVVPRAFNKSSEGSKALLGESLCYSTSTVTLRVVDPFFTRTVQVAAFLGATSFNFLIEHEPDSDHFDFLLEAGVMMDVKVVLDFFFTMNLG